MHIEMDKISTGSKVMDALLAGGYEKEVITCLFGAAGTGKSNFCMLASLTAAKQAKKVIYMDTEGGFSVERASQLFPREYKQLLCNVIFLNPTTFDEQKDAFNQIKDIVGREKVGMVIVDSVAMLYRLKKGGEANVSEVNQELARQLELLLEVARKKQIPVIVTNQVYADFEKRNDVRMVGGDLLKYRSKCIVKLEKIEEEDKSICRASIFKHRSLPSGRATYFEIQESGIEPASKSKKGFKLF